MFLADRNILIDQTMVNDFRPFKGAMATSLARMPKRWSEFAVARSAPRKSWGLVSFQHKTTKQVDKSFHRSTCPCTRQLPVPRMKTNICSVAALDFFDLIIVDERFAAALPRTRFDSSATQVGLTATLMETEEVSNSHYFGEPIYTHSLWADIEDGYPRPTRRSPASIWTVTLFGWRPTEGMRDKAGNLIEDAGHQDI